MRGELHRNGSVHQGKYRLLIDRQTFDTCQDILNGKNRRTSHHVHVFSGGIIRCAHCGFAVTAECIRRKLLDGGVREHVYYRCANNNKPDDHPPMLVREEDLLDMFMEEFAAFKMPPDIAEWFCMTIQTAFADVGELQRQRKQSMAKRKTELAGMQDRLLNGYLSGAIDQAVFQTKTADLKREIAQVEESLERATSCDPDAIRLQPARPGISGTVQTRRPNGRFWIA